MVSHVQFRSWCWMQSRQILVQCRRSKWICSLWPHKGHCFLDSPGTYPTHNRLNIEGAGPRMWVHSGIMKTFNCNISTQFVENKSIFLRMENRRISVFFSVSQIFGTTLWSVYLCYISLWFVLLNNPMIFCQVAFFISQIHLYDNKVIYFIIFK